MTKENRKILGKIYGDASEDERRKRNVACYKAYWEETKRDEEIEKAAKKAEEEAKKKSKSKVKK